MELQVPRLNMSEPTWKAVAKGAQDYLQASIDRVRPVVQDLPHLVQALDCSGLPKKLLSAKEVEITETSTENLVSALAKRKYNAVEVVSAFLRRAVIAQHAVLDDPSPQHARMTFTDQLCHRTPSRASHRACQVPR